MSDLTDRQVKQVGIALAIYSGLVFVVGLLLGIIIGFKG